MQTRTKAVLLEFFQADNDLLVYVIRPDLPSAGIRDKAPIILRLSIQKAAVAAVVHQIRQDLKTVSTVSMHEFDERFQPSLDTFYQLGRQVFNSELMQLIAPFDGVYLVPFGDWNYLPLHAMEVGPGKLLIDDFEVAYLPNASVLQFIKENTTHYSPTGALFAGADYTDESGLFRDEVRQISDLPVFGADAVCLRPRETTLDNIVKHAGGKRVIHISSHGYFNPDNALASGALLWNGPDGIAATTAELAENPAQYNILSANGIFELLQLQAEIVVLSGCVTGQSERRPGDELIGLSRALLYAGAQSMIVALFPVLKNVTAHAEDNIGQSRFAHFYELWLQEGYTRSQAFRKWVLAIKRIPKFAHPYCWFSYIYMGKI